jgi:beta-lactamase regulating signal transducer with metallopeptidase domain
VNPSWFLSPEWIALLFALLHTLWQGSLAAGLLFLALRVTSGRRVNLRYGLSAGALLCVLLAGFGTWRALEIPAQYPPVKEISSLTRQIARGSSSTSLANLASLDQAPRAPSQRAPMHATAARPVWPVWLGSFWLFGVFVSLVRALRSVIGVEYLRRRCRIVVDSQLLALIEDLRTRLRITRRIILMVSDEIGVPSVMGILWPVVLLPASLLTGIPPEQMRAILAHELAHIRRWDYLVNLAQVVIEAFLFFNPFVWWISRQMRLEREACCDHLAAAQCQSSARYVEALISVLDRSRPAAPALVMAACGPAGSALERAPRRLLVPGHVPALRLRWFSMVLVLLTAGGALCSLWVCTRAVAQTITHPAQKLAQPAFDMDSRSWDVGWTLFAQGNLSTEDGRPLDYTSAKVSANTVLYMGPNASGGQNPQAQFVNPKKADGAFTVEFERPRSVTFLGTMEGYAPTFLGPFTVITRRWDRTHAAYPATFVGLPPSREKDPSLNITLSRGFAATIRVFDEMGTPIPGAKLNGQYPGPPSLDIGETETDSSGIATLRHIGAAPLNLSVSADGYQADQINNVHLDASHPYQWTLKKAQSLQGIVTSDSGQPIPGAEIKLGGVQGPEPQMNADPAVAPVLAATDAQGRFTLTTLRADSIYFLFVDAPQHSGVLLTDIRAPGPALKIALGPELFVHGKVIHAYPPFINGKDYPLAYGQPFVLRDGGAFTSCKCVTLKPRKGEADFTIGPVYKWPVVFVQPGGKSTTIAPSNFSKPGLILDMAEAHDTTP